MSNNKYNHNQVEKKWQGIWDETNAFDTTEHNSKKIYILDMFPYPSGEGLHVGHLVGYTATDVFARYKRLNNYDVLHPMGWDAFGLPAEQYAIQTGNSPFFFNKKNIQNFKRQIKSLGFSYDWKKEIDTTDPAYYAQTQEIFRLLYKNGLAVLKNTSVNWCPELGTVLSNEEVLIDEQGNKISERGMFPVFQKEMKQWVLLITKYADKLLKGLDDIEFSESVKSLQRNWIGKTKGWGVVLFAKQTKIEIPFFLDSSSALNGAQAIFLNLFDEKVKHMVNSMDAEVSKSFEKDTTQINNKTGFSNNVVVLRETAVNFDLKIELPIIVGYTEKDTYNSGVILIKPTISEREKWIFEKAKSLAKNPEDFSIKPLESLENPCTVTTCTPEIRYKIHDWIFSRQRYWGEPFPILHKDGRVKLVEETVLLPVMQKIEPTFDGTSPLAKNTEWVNVEIDGQTWQRDTSTMPQWAGSSWYFLAYILKNPDGSYEKLDSPEAQKRFKKWMPVDIYVGGQEHAVLHLLYSRFWYKFLYELGLVPQSEPFVKLINQGMILGNDGNKMSKSKGNVINPDKLVEDVGADAIRVYEMFMGPFTETKVWSEASIISIRKWMDKVWNICSNLWEGSTKIDTNNFVEQQSSLWHHTIKEVTELIENFKYNVAISKLMVFFREISKFETVISVKMFKEVVILLSVFAPHMSEEILEKMGEGQLKTQSWPRYNEEKITKTDFITLGVQVNGKLRATLEASTYWDQETTLERAFSLTNIQKYLKDCKNIKKIFVKNKIVNFVCEKELNDLETK